MRTDIPNTRIVEAGRMPTSDIRGPTGTLRGSRRGTPTRQKTARHEAVGWVVLATLKRRARKPRLDPEAGAPLRDPCARESQAKARCFTGSETSGGGVVCADDGGLDVINAPGEEDVPRPPTFTATEDPADLEREGDQKVLEPHV